MKQAFVYIMANFRPTLYVGVTNNLRRRVLEHKKNVNLKSFCSKYGLHKLVYFEELENILDAIIREKQIKGYSRQEKLRLIEENNPNYTDLFSALFKE
jgi:putative endonuclease